MVNSKLIIIVQYICVQFLCKGQKGIGIILQGTALFSKEFRSILEKGGEGGGTEYDLGLRSICAYGVYGAANGSAIGSYIVRILGSNGKPRKIIVQTIINDKAERFILLRRIFQIGGNSLVYLKILRNHGQIFPEKCIHNTGKRNRGIFTHGS